MSAATPEDLRWLDAAARAAEPFLGTTADNPTVAAFVVDPSAGILVGRAVTARGGRPHAEPLALESAGARARGATLYVTLEPCHHWGRTPPCVDAVVRAGIARVVIGMPDPDPRTRGESIRRLHASGIEVAVIDHAPSVRLNEGHTARHALGRPFVTAKLAVSADGMIGRRDVAKVAITGEDARRWTHLQRAMSNAVLVGGATAEIDDPQLTVRLPGLERRTPLRVILAGNRGIDKRSNLIGGFSGHRVAVIVESGREMAVPASVEVVRVPGEDGRPDLAETLRALHAKGIARLLVEPGATLAEALLADDLVDRFELIEGTVTVGPDGVPATGKGTMDERLAAAGFGEIDRQRLGEDLLRTFEKVGKA
ncbi:bifunctional diaminohydroxyphosphoribosylaminopyrimidine deaminase/5-amino-6-(5-phosphoribosylamino)uracil reductase RibD [Devosia nitrariae]|uniref:Riboflavin biosynthesis protein RibD n=1 Tax=Devosia nitrariae TaxID=2071872 RepID=A0ABQ5W994_9HYPH|nr:bifunctional diaminohydroxyphosphoribosylaminopyrimidine deaminase/5-amino-6-(5-phosphoribosylamino)uracil reductase RibD [Devosia nitrariae]GLQ56288.1 riboflavin biosynthesis protein RibD [Devosia nitrariae]